MRALIELFIIALVIFAAWRQPFRDHVAGMFPQTGIKQSRLAQLAKNAPLPTADPDSQSLPAQPPRAERDSSWMWGPTSLDKPGVQKGGGGGR